ncbi:tryptophanyl-tRNA synthetase [Amanita muscaria]
MFLSKILLRSKLFRRHYSHSPRIIFSGIQPTGVPHLGNYLGALSNWVKLQNEARVGDELIYSIVGWHALTIPQDPEELSASRRDTLATLLAIGIDPNRSIVFHQDQVHTHTELAWVLGCITPVGKLRRMTTWKSRLAAARNANSESEVDESLLNVGLLSYPALQAADILVYRATHVPVGEDQAQHLELCRELAENFNRSFASSTPLFSLPIQVDTPFRRILSLKDPSSKMSKSAPDVQSRILLNDDAGKIKAKIRGAVTDSIHGITYDPISRPGTSNLLTILAACTNEKVEAVAKQYGTKGHGQLKVDVYEAIEEMLKGPRTEFEKIRRDIPYLERVARMGAEKARQKSELTMCEVRNRLGLT